VIIRINTNSTCRKRRLQITHSFLESFAQAIFFGTVSVSSRVDMAGDRKIMK
jgi:hypothetical protein